VTVTSVARCSAQITQICDIANGAATVS
jgi:hypothetical protein